VFEAPNRIVTDQMQTTPVNPAVDWASGRGYAGSNSAKALN